ncbi:MAG: hypothetical protein HY762_08385 [Planctomycetes bacterium]|nr:hypothetical protein [Planctomycetota bacterium]
MDKIDDFNEIKNLGYTPVLALNDPSLRTSGTGIKYKSSGNLGIDITYLGWIEAGRKIYGP